MRGAKLARYAGALCLGALAGAVGGYAGALALVVTVGAPTPSTAPTWAAIVEADGESAIVERGTLGDCMAALARFDEFKPSVSTYCERESS